MSNLTKPRDCNPFLGDKFNDVVKSAVQIWKGALVLTDSNGELINAETGASGVCRGVAQESVLGDGTKRCEVRTGMFLFHILSTDAVDAGELEQVVYAEDNQTIAKTSDGGARPAAGRLKMITADSKAVVGVGPLFSVDGDLLAANNLSDVADPSTAAQNIGALEAANDLSDVADAATARDNIGLTDDAAGRATLSISDSVALRDIDLDIDNTDVVRYVATKAGTLTSIRTVTNGALATGDATVTAAINGTPVTNGVVTIAQAGSAADDVDSATPSAANTFVAGDVLTFTVGGTQDGSVTAGLSIEFTY